MKHLSLILDMSCVEYFYLPLVIHSTLDKLHTNSSTLEDEETETQEMSETWSVHTVALSHPQQLPSSAGKGT